MSREGIKYKKYIFLLKIEIVLGILNRLIKGGVTINDKTRDKRDHLLEYTA